MKEFPNVCYLVVGYIVGPNGDIMVKGTGVARVVPLCLEEVGTAFAHCDGF